MIAITKESFISAHQLRVRTTKESIVDEIESQLSVTSESGNYYPGKAFQINFPTKKQHFSPEIIDEIEKMYVEAGWDVSKDVIEKEDDFIEITFVIS